MGRLFGTPAGNPLSLNTYGSELSQHNSKLETPSSPRSPSFRRSVGDVEPITKVLGKNAEYVDASSIPEADLVDASAVALTTHDGSFGTQPVLMNWGASTPETRGPVLATTRH